jgi:hypothetical protein
MKYFVEILKQFTIKQRIFVLVLLLFFSSLTYITTTYLKSGHNSCEELIKLNQKYVHDFVIISDMIRRQRMNELGVGDENLLDSGVQLPTYGRNPASEPSSPPSSSSSQTYNDVLLDSILSVTETNLK